MPARGMETAQRSMRVVAIRTGWRQTARNVSLTIIE